MAMGGADGRASSDGGAAACANEEARRARYRENYLHLAFFGEIPDPWTTEHVADLPAEFQDWSKFD
jgi:hypothetical protein